MEAIPGRLVDDECLSQTALTNAQSTSEVVNPSPTGEVATGPLPPACAENLQAVVEQVGDQLRQLTLKRQSIDRRIAILKRTLKGLALLYGDVLLHAQEDPRAPERGVGITHACRLVVDRADTPLTAREVYAVLREEFPGVFRTPGNHRASLFTILKRLTTYGEIDTFLRNGSRFWQRRRQPDTRQAGLPGI